MNLPTTLDFSGVPGRKEEPLPVFDPKRYEQLLATAVLNKVSALRVKPFSGLLLAPSEPFFTLFDYQFSPHVLGIDSCPNKSLRRCRKSNEDGKKCSESVRLNL